MKLRADKENASRPIACHHFLWHQSGVLSHRLVFHIEFGFTELTSLTSSLSLRTGWIPGLQPSAICNPLANVGLPCFQTRVWVFQPPHPRLEGCWILENASQPPNQKALSTPPCGSLFRLSDHTDRRMRRCTASEHVSQEALEAVRASGERGVGPMRLELFCMLRQWTFGQAILLYTATA
jgi:hypothetical protein